METKFIEAPWHKEDPQYFGPETRSLFFSEDITPKTSMNLISQLLELNARSSDPIKLYINTNGGSLVDAFAIFDTIKAIRSPVYTIVKGLCASGGLILLLAGSKRYATENSLFFYHQPILTTGKLVSLEHSQGVSEIYTLSKDLFDDKIKTITNMSNSLWLQNFEGRTYKYFNSENAKSMGFIHKTIQTIGD